MIGVVIPAHDEAGHIAAAVRSVFAAAADPALRGEAVELVVVLDDCADATGPIARGLGARTLAVARRNVGAARAAGAQALLERGARWLGFTDADTRVSEGWLASQLALGADCVCGVVSVDDWSPHGAQAGFLERHFARTYHPRDGHRHIHGANLGVSAAAYNRAGGFQPLACGEDVALVHALRATGAVIAWSAAPRVVTSARLDARARGGFGDTLLGVIDAATHTLGEAIASCPAQTATGP